MKRQEPKLSTNTSLAVLVECVALPLLRRHPGRVCYESNIDLELMTTASPDHLRSLIESLVKDSLDQMPDDGELTVSGCITANGVELEIADTGSDAQHRGQSLSIFAAALGCKPHWQNCPQGGAAVTIVLPFNNAARKAA